jgi:hypothetical protein
LDEALVHITPLAQVFGIYERYQKEYNGFVRNMERIADYIWENYREIFNPGAVEILKMLKDNRDKIDMVVILSNNGISLTLDVVRTIINKHIGGGTVLIDDIFHKAWPRMRSDKSKSELAKCLATYHPEVKFSSKTKIFFMDDQEHLLSTEANVTYHKVSPGYFFYKDPSPYYNFVYGMVLDSDMADAFSASNMKSLDSPDGILNRSRSRYEEKKNLYGSDYIRSHVESFQKFLDGLTGISVPSGEVIDTPRDTPVTPRKTIETPREIPDAPKKSLFARPVMNRGETVIMTPSGTTGSRIAPYRPVKLSTATTPTAKNGGGRRRGKKSRKNGYKKSRK